MLVFEFKAYGNKSQFAAVNEAIRTAQFVRNSCLRYWMDNPKVNKYDLNKYCAVLARDFSFADELNSQARQASAERAWSAISRFYENCKKGLIGQKDTRSSRKTVALSSTNRLAGSLQKIGNQSNLPTKKESENSSSKERGICIFTLCLKSKE